MAASDRFTDRLSDYLDGDVSPNERREIDAHLAQCASCRAVLEELRAVVRRAKEIGANPPEPSHDGWPRVASEIGVRGTSRRGPYVLVALAAAAAVIAIVSWVWLAPRRTEQVASSPRYLLLLHEPAERGEPESPEAHRAVVERYAAWARSLARDGRLDAGEELAADLGWSLHLDAEPMRVEHAPSGDKVGGFFIVRAPSDAEAVLLARGCPHLSNGGWIELRRIQQN
ncbi:MAG: zf-HC2 domain-containing protein [Planctomycetes bacterium]|nr:zf-HC2 domain-containing protein [Planctomycetota bacterium]MBI3847172.1 zf-HC2 domain-containing protein [Planctomycetota bacterium]